MSDTTTIETLPRPKRIRSRRRKLSDHGRRSQSDRELQSDEEPNPPPPPPQMTPRRRSPLPSDPHVRIAMYVAMAHAGLALSLALLYFVTKLLEGCWRPIQWAILCSMPLRELRTALVSFWSRSLSLGLFETLIAVPVAALRAATDSVVDSQAAFFGLLRQSEARSREKVGFFKLVQWLISFALFIIVYENIGLVSVPVFAIACFIVYFMGSRTMANAGVRTSLSALSSFRRGGRKFLKKSSLGSKVGRYITGWMLNRLKTTVGIGLIVCMILGSVFGIVFFSYKIAMEGKDAVISLKAHLKENNYAERIGVTKFMDENHIPELIDNYTMKFYEAVSDNINSLAAHYNVTEVVDGVRHYLISPSPSPIISSSSAVPQGVEALPLSEKLNRIRSKIWNSEWIAIYRDIDGVFRDLVSLISREDLMEKIKSLFLQSMDMSRRLLASGTTILTGGVNLLFFMAVSFVSGAAGLLNFISGFMVFLWLLYYLITTESGGVMDHVLEMLPLSRFTRARCAHVLDQAVSSVLLAAAKVTFFQGCLTYLLFRFYKIHFLYMSTFLALMSAVLPITPAWLSSIPAAVQLAMEARYVEAVLLTGLHQLVLEYGTTAIQDEIPGQSAYLTGLSMLGGIALFPSILEGAIMGPLLMTVMIALKNLYVEFVLSSADETCYR
ncbi:Transmembrane protein TqsA-like [Trema orientale]|uniref:Transmembrane protein TqsA-like n=1 Tax=Trema orientale TaxID=63057 RepID=A0A2P5BFQ4_TREOI|nr:Transmembrane protein TqsA-like [Trema orientale]